MTIGDYALLRSTRMTELPEILTEAPHFVPEAAHCAMGRGRLSMWNAKRAIGMPAGEAPAAAAGRVDRGVRPNWRRASN
jgi:hypothetical protein